MTKTCPKCSKQFNPGWDKKDDDPIVNRMRETGLCWFCAAGINMERAPRKRSHRSGPPPAAQPSPGTPDSHSSQRVTTMSGTGEGGGNGEAER